MGHDAHGETGGMMKMVVSEADIREAAMAICRERCAHMGEPACWRIKDDQDTPLPWPAPACDDPGCLALAQVALHTFANKAAGELESCLSG